MERNAETVLFAEITEMDDVSYTDSERLKHGDEDATASWTPPGRATWVIS